MTYIYHSPSPPLSDYIDHFYYLDSPMPYRHERILPIPALDLKINLGGAFHFSDHAGHSNVLTESWFVGLFGVPHNIDWPSDLRLYGVCFKPGGAYPFLRLPLSELYNQVVPLDVVWGQFAAEIREQLYAAPTFQIGLALFERLMVARLCEKPREQNLLDYALAMIDRSHGALSIKSLSDGIGISQNHLGTYFKRIVGTSAKEIARLYRFGHVLRSIDPTHPVDWLRIAYQYGYYDQSHLNKDFTAFTGYSPTAYLRLRRLVYAQDSQVDQLSSAIYQLIEFLQDTCIKFYYDWECVRIPTLDSIALAEIDADVRLDRIGSHYWNE